MNHRAEHFQTLFSADRTVDDCDTEDISAAYDRRAGSIADPRRGHQCHKSSKEWQGCRRRWHAARNLEAWRRSTALQTSRALRLRMLPGTGKTTARPPRRYRHHSAEEQRGKSRTSQTMGGITPLSIAGKILARVLLDRLVPAVSKYYLPESLCGFRANMGTTDMVFVLRQLQEKCREQNKGLYITFVNPSKAFDTVSRKGLWKIMERLGCPPKFLSMVMQLHEDRCGQIRNSNELSEPFPILNGVKQGCVLVPTLFTIFFNIMLQRSHRRSRRR